MKNTRSIISEGLAKEWDEIIRQADEYTREIKAAIEVVDENGETAFTRGEYDPVEVLKKLTNNRKRINRLSDIRTGDEILPLIRILKTVCECMNDYCVKKSVERRTPCKST